MAEISFLKPLEQPVGERRFLGELERCLDDTDLNSFRFAVAFAKTGPFFRLANRFENWKTAGKSVEAIFGIDHLGTSRQVLEFALQNFSKVYVTHVDFIRSNRVTFHPKQYLFYGDNSAVCYVGSHNMTTGGTETNFEAGVRIKMSRPQDEEVFQDALSAWTSLLPSHDISTRELTDELLDELTQRGLLLDEIQSARENVRQTAIAPNRTPLEGLFPKLPLRPASPLPHTNIRKRLRPSRQQPMPLSVTAPADNTISASTAAQTFIIQIVPHHNGEVFLSYRAIQENPEFFDYPFTGWTTPKKTQNRPYPQRTPDPVVDIFIYNDHGELQLASYAYLLNTVYYSTKSEIRITFSPDLIAAIPEYSIMVMEKSDTPNLDYVIRIYVPGSDEFNRYYNACNQTLPSGGKEVARRMGWL